jgi:hypothetical protein
VPGGPPIRSRAAAVSIRSPARSSANPETRLNSSLDSACGVAPEAPFSSVIS